MVDGRRRRWRLVAVATGAAIGVAVAAGAGATALAGRDEAPRGFDQLSERETGRALAAVGAERSVQSGRDVVLEVARSESGDGDGAPSARRLADVVLYSYGRERAVRYVVDATTGAIVDRVEQANVQPPLAPAETRRTFQILFGDPAAKARIAAAYAKATGRELTDPARQIVATSLIFRADAQPSRATGLAAGCGLERCAQVLMASPDRYLVDVLPIVNLSRGAVANVDLFDAHLHEHAHDHATDHVPLGGGS